MYRTANSEYYLFFGVFWFFFSIIVRAIVDLRSMAFFQCLFQCYYLFLTPTTRSKIEIMDKVRLCEVSRLSVGE